MNRPRRIKTEKPSVVNVKLNANDEIEYMNIEEHSQDTVIDEVELIEQDEEEEDFEESGDEYIIEEEVEEEDDDEDEAEPELIEMSDGRMMIKIKEENKVDTVVEHVCGKCNKSYKNFGVSNLHTS